MNTPLRWFTVGHAAALIAAFVTTATLAATAVATTTFAARANAICTSYYKKLNTVPAPAKTAKAIAAYEKRVMPLAVSEYSAFKKMKPPASIRAAYSAWLSVTSEEMALVRRLVAAGEKNEASVVNKLLKQGNSLDSRYDALANKMGMTVCGQPTSTTT